MVRSGRGPFKFAPSRHARAMHEIFFENLRDPARNRRAGLMRQFCPSQLDSTLDRLLPSAFASTFELLSKPLLFNIIRRGLFNLIFSHIFDLIRAILVFSECYSMNRLYRIMCRVFPAYYKVGYIGNKNNKFLNHCSFCFGIVFTIAIQLNCGVQSGFADQVPNIKFDEFEITR